MKISTPSLITGLTGLLALSAIDLAQAASNADIGAAFKACNTELGFPQKPGLITSAQQEQLFACVKKKQPGFNPLKGKKFHEFMGACLKKSGVVIPKTSQNVSHTPKQQEAIDACRAKFQKANPNY